MHAPQICIYGLGAIGGLVAARLALAGYTVNAIARGETLAQVQAHGLTLHDAQGTRTVPVHAVQQPQALGVQDVVVVSVKTTALAEVARQMAPLIGPDTVVLSAMNGIPWWFLRGLQGAPAGLQLDSVDPAGAISQALPAQQVLGCVTHLSAAVPQPGHVRHVAGQRLILGRPQGALIAADQALVQMLGAAGFEVEVAPSIQAEIWYKLWGNMTMNPVSMLTRATGDQILDDPDVQDFLTRCMREAADIGARLGLPIAMSPQERHQVTRKLGAFKTSMLQDLEGHKPLELDALLRVVIEIGQQVGVDMPNLQTLMGLSRLKARNLGLYP